MREKRPGSADKSRLLIESGESALAIRSATFKKFWQEACAESQATAVARARAEGVYTDEDVFRLIS